MSGIKGEEGGREEVEMIEEKTEEVLLEVIGEGEGGEKKGGLAATKKKRTKRSISTKGEPDLKEKEEESEEKITFNLPILHGLFLFLLFSFSSFFFSSLFLLFFLFLLFCFFSLLFLSPFSGSHRERRKQKPKGSTSTKMRFHRKGNGLSS